MYKKKPLVLCNIGALLFVTLFLFPFFVEISSALKDRIELFTFPVTWVPKAPQWSVFIDIWKLIPIETLYFNTLYVIILTIIINLLFAAPAAYALSVLDFMGKKISMYITLVSQMFVPVLVIVPIFNIIKRIGIIDTPWALVVTNSAFSIAFVTLLLKGFFDTIPKEIEEAAYLDGCSKFGALYRIYLPVCRSGIVVSLIYNAILVNNEFLFANTLIMDNDKQMMSVALYRLIQGNPYSWEITWNHLMTAALYASLPIQILFLFIRKYITKGLISGSIK
jgi:multiple sugar transport system permease protein